MPASNMSDDKSTGSNPINIVVANQSIGLPTSMVTNLSNSHSSANSVKVITSSNDSTEMSYTYFAPVSLSTQRKMTNNSEGVLSIATSSMVTSLSSSKRCHPSVSCSVPTSISIIPGPTEALHSVTSQPTISILTSSQHQLHHENNVISALSYGHRREDKTIPAHSIKVFSQESSEGEFILPNSMGCNPDIGEGTSVSISEAEDEPGLQEMAITEVCSEGVCYETAEVHVPMEEVQSSETLK